MARELPIPYKKTEHLKERVQDLAEGLISRLHEISSSEYPNATPKIVVDILINITEKATIVAESSGEHMLGMISELIMQYGELLSDLDNANTKQTPHALTGMLEWLYRGLGSDPTLLACPEAEYNYSIWDLLHFLKQSSKYLLSNEESNEIFGKTPSINLISFPRIERDNILLHAIFGHEIGHPFADDYLQQEQLGSLKDDFQKALKDVTKAIESKFSTEFDEAKSHGFSFEVRGRIIGDVLEIRRRGLEELLSDAVAVQILGPSAIFSAHEIFMTRSIDQLPESESWYPPRRYRLRIMVDLAKRIGTWGALKAVAPQIKHALEYIEDITNEQSDILEISSSRRVQIAYDWIDEVFQDATNYVRVMIESGV